ncbi:hypothetical protein GM182_01540 [bacterium 3DAC]|nr:hypothetical protein GM182_01540 [bacterium 3DAC]
MNVKIYILAGGDQEEWCEDFGVGYKALLPWSGTTIIQHMVNNIKKDLDVPITVIGRTEWPIDTVEGATLLKIDSSSIMDTISVIQPDTDYVLLLTGDSPLVRGKDLIPFIETPSELVAGVIYKEDFEKMFPGWHKTFIPLKDGKIKLAGAALISKDKWQTVIDEGTKYYNYRKNPFMIVWKMGISLFAKLITGQLSINDVIKWVGKKFGVKATAVTVSPVMGADVDKKSDYLMLKLFETLGREKQ